MHDLRSIALPLFLVTLAAASPGVDSELAALREADLRVASVGYRLATANAELCANRAPQRGFVLHAAGQYGRPLRKSAEVYFRLGPTPSVMAVVPGGPAARAGLLQDDRLVAIDGEAVAGARPGGRSSFADVAAVEGAIDRSLADGGVALSVDREGRRLEIALLSVAGCASHFQLALSPQVAAGADGNYVTVRSGLVNFVRSDDELAVVMAHELAHNILGHRGLLAAQGVSGGLSAKFGADARRIRATEIEADRYGLYLAARAGFDVKAAPGFWERLEREHGHGIFADATHPGARERLKLVAATLAEIDGLRASGKPLLPSGNPDRAMSGSGH